MHGAGGGGGLDYDELKILVYRISICEFVSAVHATSSPYMPACGKFMEAFLPILLQTFRSLSNAWLPQVLKGITFNP